MLETHYFYLILLWFIYYALHSILAATGVKAFFARQMKASYRHYRLFYSVFQFLGLMALLLYQYSFPSFRVLPESLWLWVPAALLVAPGALIMAISLKKYFFLLSGVRSLYQPAPKAELKVDGLHRYVRHPLYLGTILFVWGLFFIWPTLTNLITVVMLTLYVRIGLVFEEQKLIREFGNDYVMFRRRVPMLIPSFRKVAR